MNRNNFEQIPSVEAKLELNDAQPVPITNAIVITSTENASSSSTLPNSNVPLECDDQSDNILNGIKV